MFIAPDARPHRFAAFLLLASSASSPSWNQPLCDDLGGDKGGDLQLDLEGKGSSLVNAFSVVENAKSQRCSSLSTQMFGSWSREGDAEGFFMRCATQVDEDDPRASGKASAPADSTVIRCGPCRASEDDGRRSRRRGPAVSKARGEDGAVRKIPLTKKKKPARQKVVMYRRYAQGELPNVGLSLAEVVRPLMALSL